jgi:hypothetical protein
MKVTTGIFIFTWMIISIVSAVKATAMTPGPGASITVTVPCCNGMTSNPTYQNNNGPSGRFWNVAVWIGRQGGTSSQPLYYYFTFMDYNNGYYTGINQCGEDKNFWSGYDPITTACSMSGLFGGLMNVYYDRPRFLQPYLQHNCAFSICMKGIEHEDKQETNP